MQSLHCIAPGLHVSEDFQSVNGSMACFTGARWHDVPSILCFHIVAHACYSMLHTCVLTIASQVDNLCLGANGKGAC